MKFLLQYNLINNDALQMCKNALEDNNIPHECIGVIPFTHEITCDEPLNGVDYIPYGSTLLVNLASERKWTGVHFDLQKMNYGCFVKNRKDMLNDNVMPVKDAVVFLQCLSKDTKVFTRPSEDLKQYSGQVMEAGEIWPWFESMMAAVGGGSYYMSPETEVVISKPKEISAEWRWFIVGGKIIDGSMYRAHGQLRKLHETDDAVINEAQALADIWLPHDCVVMDTALVGGEMKVIEFNCINGSGMYDNDVGKIFNALWKYHAGK